MVVDNHTLMSSCVVNRERSWLDFKTENIGKSSFLHMVSQNSTGYVAPYVFRLVNKESNALSKPMSTERKEKQKLYYLQPSDFQVLRIHDDIVKSKQDGVPIFDEIIIR